MGTLAAETWRSRSRYCLFGVIAMTAIFFRFIWFDQKEYDARILKEVKIFGGACLMCFILIGLISWDIGRLNPADSHSLSSVLFQYIVCRISSKFGRRFLNNFNKGAKDVQEQQKKLLSDLLSANKDTEYGKAHQFKDMKTVKDFQCIHPVVTYEHFRPYVQKVIDGEKNIMTTSLISYVTRTSGTTGRNKLVPYNGEWQKLLVTMWPYLIYEPEIKGAKLQLQKMLMFSFKPRIDTNEKSGLKIAPLSHFLNTHYSFLNFPKCVLEIDNEKSAFYVHAIFALMEPDLCCLMFSFTNQLYSFFKFMEIHFDSICEDIEFGTLNPKMVDVSESLYGDLCREVKPNVKRAAILRQLMSAGIKGFAKRAWPSLTYIRSTGTGSMEMYTRLLKQTYLEGVMIINGLYGGSEGIYGLSLSANADDSNYTLLYKFGFFEFLPEMNIEDEDLREKTVLAHEVQVGGVYELIVTNSLGLYRYRVGDVVKITGFNHNCPIFEFQYRIGQILNVVNEKTTEATAYNALLKACSSFNVKLIDYTMCEDVYLHGIQALKEYRRSYVLFIELDRKLQANQLERFDKYLCEESELYNHVRTRSNMMGPMEVIQVKSRTFWKLKEVMTKELCNNQQFKMPRALRVREHLNLLKENRMS